MQVGTIHLDCPSDGHVETGISTGPVFYLLLSNGIVRTRYFRALPLNFHRIRLGNPNKKIYSARLDDWRDENFSKTGKSFFNPSTFRGTCAPGAQSDAGKHFFDAYQMCMAVLPIE